MAKGRELKGRIKSVENTRKITKTMEMVATSKMKRATDRVVAARPYATALSDVIGSLYSPDLADRFPLLRQPAGKAKKAAVIVLTGNRGLSGAFNSNLIKEARNLIARLESEGTQVDIHAIGKKGLGYFRYLNRAVKSSRIDAGDAPTTAFAGEVVDSLITEFSTGAIDAVYVVAARFVSALSAPATTERILPVTPPKAGKMPDYLLYPSAGAILEKLLPAYVRNALYRALVDTVAGFYSAQRTAMKNATDNAGEMLNVLRRTYNRARQAQITQEIAEIVGGSAALEG